jgi:hypothetical protein
LDLALSGLGSLQGDATPEAIRLVACGRLLLNATDPFTYVDAVSDLLDVWADEGYGHGYHPRDGWPWLWPDSRGTDWVFSFANGRVSLTTGEAWRPYDKARRQEDGSRR